MPVYVYEVIKPDGSRGERFEIHQPMKEAALSVHPETGHPVRRVIMAPNLGLKHTEGSTKKSLENRSLEKKGFTKYEKDKLTGTYHRVAGKDGPDTIRRPD